MPNERWGERPLLVVVPKQGAGAVVFRGGKLWVNQTLAHVYRSICACTIFITLLLVLCCVLCCTAQGTRSSCAMVSSRTWHHTPVWQSLQSQTTVSLCRCGRCNSSRAELSCGSWCTLSALQ